MKNVLSALVLSCAVLLSAACSEQESNLLPYVGNADIIIDFNDDVDIRRIKELESELGVEFVPNSTMFSATKIARIRGGLYSNHMNDVLQELQDSGLLENAPEVDQQLRLIDPVRNDSNFEQPNAVTSFDQCSQSPNDPLYTEGKQWHMKMINVEKAWESVKGKGSIVAVLDTGVSTGKGKYQAVPDLKDNKFRDGKDFIVGGIDAYDANSHGTHVSGTIAQTTNNGIGGVGVAPLASIMPVKVLSDEGYGSTAAIAEAIRWAADNGADVINMSLGGGGHSKIMADAVAYAHKKGVFVACAAGNSGRAVIEYPAAYDGCQAVSAVGPSGNMSFYSSHGTNGSGLFISAPGGEMKRGEANSELGGVWQNTVKPGDPTKHGYFPYQGTSMATPHVAGVAALVVEQFKSSGFKYTADDVAKAIAAGAVVKGDTAKYGHGLLNAANAVDAAKKIAGGESVDVTPVKGSGTPWFKYLFVIVMVAFFSWRNLRKN